MRYQHDCDGCKPLGAFGDADLYYCDKSVLGPTVIARYSSEGGDYISGMVFAATNRALHEARLRAIELGYKVK